MDAMLLLIEKELADTVTNEKIAQFFQEMAKTVSPQFTESLLYFIKLPFMSLLAITKKFSPAAQDPP